MNADPLELDKFSRLASRWWDPDGDFRPLHQINPLRLGWIQERTGGLADKRVVDVGCGGGILAESMAGAGAQVTGIDLSEAALDVARLHLLESGATVDYRHVDAEVLAQEAPASFDVVTCLEVLEHVPDPAAYIRTCAGLLKPGGDAFFATINRNLKSFLFAILGAEYVLKLLPRGTHEYARFVRPAELAAGCRTGGLQVAAMRGMLYNPLTKVFSLSDDLDVNYLLHARAP